MAGFVTNALSGLLAAQRSLQTTSSNIANATTEGYTRQRVVQVQGPVIGSGTMQLGYGTQIIGTERIYDQLLANQLTAAKTGQAKSQIVNQYALRLEGYIGDPDVGIANSLAAFYETLNVLANDPTSTVNRQQVLAEAEALAQRFRQLGGQLDALEGELNNRLQATVTTVNDDLQAIAQLNGKIVADGGNAASALLDERQLLIDRVAEKIDIQTVAQPDGGVNLMMTNGQPLVLGINAFQLGVQQDEFNPARLQLTHTDGTTSQVVSRLVTGGEIGGLLTFRDEMLDSARRELGAIAIGLTETFNQQNAQGMDLNGNLGADLFAGFAPEVLPSVENTGGASIAAVFSDVAALEARDYRLKFNGGSWTLTDASGGGSIAMTGSGAPGDPFVVDGMELVITGAAAAGDEFRIQPVASAAADVRVVMADASGIAAAAPLATSAQLFNQSDAAISAAAVTDIGNPNLLQSVRIVFDTPPSTYRITDGSGTVLQPSQPYTSGDDIAFNGWSLQVSGTPAAGDTFVVARTSPASGDNSNANALAAQFSEGFFRGGQVSVEDLSAQLTTAVGSFAARSQADLNVQTVLRDQLQLDLEAVAGVNLEEEAVNMLRYQEAYLAASKMISVSNDLFQSIINAIR